MQVGGVLQDRVAGGMAFSTGFLLLEVVLLMAARGEAQGVSLFESTYASLARWALRMQLATLRSVCIMVSSAIWN